MGKHYQESLNSKIDNLVFDTLIASETGDLELLIECCESLQVLHPDNKNLVLHRAQNITSESKKTEYLNSLICQKEDGPSNSFSEFNTEIEDIEYSHYKTIESSQNETSSFMTQAIACFNLGILLLAGSLATYQLFNPPHLPNTHNKLIDASKEQKSESTEQAQLDESSALLLHLLEKALENPQYEALLLKMLSTPLNPSNKSDDTSWCQQALRDSESILDPQDRQNTIENILNNPECIKDESFILEGIGHLSDPDSQIYTLLNIVDRMTN